VKKYQPGAEAVASPGTDFRLRSRSSRRAGVAEANMTMDGVTVLNQSWAGHDTVTEKI
jgi:hypothetical protein